MGRGFYTLLLRISLPFIWMRLWWRGRREPGYREHVAERFGRYAAQPRANLIWLHAVSVGEARASAPLVRGLQRELRNFELLLTCTTATGRATLEQVFGQTVHIAYLPYDFPEAARRFLEHFKPRLGIVMETEVWPNLLAACQEMGVPVMLANARLSRKSARGYRRFAKLTRPAFAAFSAICAQSARAARRLRWLGARHTLVTGNLKFDVEPDAAKVSEGYAFKASLRGRKVLLLASTRDGEEARLLDALRMEDDGTLVILVPRHPQRFDDVAALIEIGGFSVARRSLGQAPHSKRRVYLGDTMGEMSFYYTLADVAVIGGSFLPLGGQNLIEACAAGVPVVFGPSMFNFAEAAQLALQSGAAVQVSDAREAISVARALIADQTRCTQMGLAGARLCAAHRGATERHLETCGRLLNL